MGILNGLEYLVEFTGPDLKRYDVQGNKVATLVLQNKGMVEPDCQP